MFASPVRRASKRADDWLPMFPAVVVTSRGAQRVESGHPWVYRADLVEAHARAGDRVVVRGPRGRTLGYALYSDRSKIAIRMLTRGHAVADDELLKRRIETAIRFRESLALDASAYRLVHGEGDLLPSLVVDRYGEHVVVQTLSQGMDRLLPLVVATIQDVVQPRGILAR